MARALLAVVDASRARLFTYQQSLDTQVLSELHEEYDLVNIARRQRPSELFSDTPGADRLPGGRGFGYDDHRDAHIAQLDTVFAGEVAAQIERLARAGSYVRLVLVASPRMLGELRKAVRDRDLAIDEVPHDLTKLTAPQLHDRLAALRLLPARERLLMARR